MLLFLGAKFREPPLKLSTQDSPQTAKSEPSGHGPVSAGSETLASMVHSRILTDIIEGRLKPGRKLNTRLLVESYGAGNSPVREALSQLAGEGLVVRQERTGFRVAPTSAEELLEIVTTRCSLEETALRESIEHGGERWEDRIILAHYRLSRTPRPQGESLLDDRLEWENHHREFHLALISACKSGILLGYCAELQERSFRYRNLSSVRAYRNGRAVDDHRAICDAVLERDADRAVSLLTSHYRATGEVVASSERVSGVEEERPPLL